MHNITLILTMCDLNVYNLIEEGTTKILTPISNKSDKIISNVPVFFNPIMELNRDISIAVTAVFVNRLIEKKNICLSDIRYADALAASGVRGVRIANEIGLDTTINDWKQSSYNLIKKNIQLNSLEKLAKATHNNANVLLYSDAYHIVDIDPFGSPSQFLDAACKSVVNLLEITATDTASLCGAHLNSGIRKYSAVPFNNEYHSEMGVRILLGKVAFELAKHDKGMVPLLSHATKHYIRTYLEIEKGAKNANRTLKNIGYIVHCIQCGHRESLKGIAIAIDKYCKLCGKKVNIAGPIWLGILHTKEFLNDVLIEIENRCLSTKLIATKIISLCKYELDTPTFYDQHKICKSLKISAKDMNSLIELLKKNGFKASRTHFNGTSFKTDAEITIIKEIVATIE